MDAVEGLQPSKEQHALFLDVHPVSGTRRDPHPGAAATVREPAAGRLALLSWHCFEQVSIVQRLVRTGADKCLWLSADKNVKAIN